MEQARTWQIATRVALWIVAVLFVILIATGIALTFRYRPTVTRPYASVTDLEPRSPITLRGIHRLAAAVFVPAVGALAIATIGLFLARRTRAPIALSLLAGLATLAASFTGYLLPWDQLALWAVTVDTDMRGYGPILRHGNVKYVILGSREIDVATFNRWFWTHTVLIPVVIVAVLVALAVAARRPRSTVPTEDGREGDHATRCVYSPARFRPRRRRDCSSSGTRGRIPSKS